MENYVWEGPIKTLSLKEGFELRPKMYAEYYEDNTDWEYREEYEEFLKEKQNGCEQRKD